MCFRLVFVFENLHVASDYSRGTVMFAGLYDGTVVVAATVCRIK